MNPSHSKAARAVDARSATRGGRPSRRTLLKLAAAAPLIHVLGGCGDKPAASGSPSGAAGTGQSALVIGGGLCGLVVLDRLVKSGWNARLLEASPRLGGRIITVREGLSGGLRAELGAERVPENDERLRALLEELEIEAGEYPAPKRPPLVTIDGKTYPFGSADHLLPDAVLQGLTDLEREDAPLYCHLGVAKVSGEPKPDDPRTAIEWLRTAGLSKRGEELTRKWCVHDLDHMPAAAFFRAAHREMLARQSDCVVGGTDRIISRLAAPHQARITLSTPITEIAQDGTEARAKDAQGNVYRAAYAVICLPLKPLQKLAFAGGTPAAVAARLAGFATADEMKVCAEVPADAFDADGRAEYTFRERFPRVAWRLPEQSASGSFVLSSLAFGSDMAEVRSADAYGPEGLQNLVYSRAPELAAARARVLTHDFGKDPFIGAAVTYVRSAAGLAGTPIKEGRIVVAGGDISEAPGWMDGAVSIAEGAVHLLVG